MHKDMVMDNRQMQACIDACRACEQECASAVTHCLGLGGRHATVEHITLMLDCARICATASDFMVWGSRQSGHICAVCADSCTSCAKACEQFSDDATLVRCAQACRKCTDACLEMAQMSMK